MDTGQIIDYGTIAILVGGFIGLWRAYQRIIDHNTTLLDMQMEQTKCLERNDKQLSELVAAMKKYNPPA